MEYNVKCVENSSFRGARRADMRAEKYLMNYIEQSNISKGQVKADLGIDMDTLVNEHQELLADEFIQLCLYLGINPDEVMNAVVL